LIGGDKRRRHVRKEGINFAAEDDNYDDSKNLMEFELTCERGRDSDRHRKIVAWTTNATFNNIHVRIRCTVD